MKELIHVFVVIAMFVSNTYLLTSVIKRDNLPLIDGRLYYIIKFIIVLIISSSVWNLSFVVERSKVVFWPDIILECSYLMGSLVVIYCHKYKIKILA